MNPLIEEEISDYPFDPLEMGAIQTGAYPGEGVKSRRGAPKLLDMWTRVISFSYDNLQHIRCVPIQTDIEIA